MPPGQTGSAKQRTPELSVIRRVAPYLWPRDEPEMRRRVLAAFAFLLLSKLATVLTPWLFKLGVDALGGSVPERVLLVSVPVWLVLAYGIARVAGVGFNQLRDAVFAAVAQRGLRRMALETFEHIHRLSLRYHLERKTGALSRVIERGVKGVEFVLRFLIFNIGPLLLELVLVAGIFWWAFGISYFWVILVTLVAYVWFTFAVSERRVKIRRAMNERDTDANQKAVDSQLNSETVKYFSAESREAARYDAAMAGYERAAVDTATSLAWLNAGQAGIITLGMAVVMAMAAGGVAAGTATVGDFVMVNAYMLQIAVPLNFLGFAYREIRQALVDMGDMFRLLDQPAEIADAPDAPPLALKGGAVAFDDVAFGYDADRPILRGVTLSVPAGRKLAVVGPSGAGKSTIARLICRFYDVTGGAVRIDGQDIRRIAQGSLRAAIGVVPQDTVLFNDTIGYNIAYGRDGATQAEVEAAAKAARIHDFVMGLPKGYDTVVGERGLKLSGGEKQRVAIARTILKNPPILILDEATSALDSATEASIQEALGGVAAGRTTIVIAHRLSTITDADEILVMDKGRVIERGRHEALLARGGAYAEMWALQQAEDEAAETDAA